MVAKVSMLATHLNWWACARENGKNNGRRSLQEKVNWKESLGRQKSVSI